MNSEVSRSARIATIPNLLTAIRALGVPLFLYTFIHLHRPTLSFLILAVGAATDYFDGKVARWLDQASDFGAAFDPAIDRLYIITTIIALAKEGYLPWWLVAVLIVRDLWMAVALAVHRQRHGRNFEVSFLGKAATFNLLYAFPFILLQGSATFGGAVKSGVSPHPLRGLHMAFHIFGWSFALWGVALYVVTAMLYTRAAFSYPE